MSDATETLLDIPLVVFCALCRRVSTDICPYCGHCPCMQVGHPTHVDRRAGEGI